MGLFGKMKDMYRVQKQAKSAKKELKKIHIEAEADNLITVVISGELEVISVTLKENILEELRQGSVSKSRIEEAIKKAFEKALKKAQEISSEKMKGVWNELGIGK